MCLTIVIPSRQSAVRRMRVEESQRTVKALRSMVKALALRELRFLAEFILERSEGLGMTVVKWSST